jgi:Phage gp6-like head-tail connector protein
LCKKPSAGVSLLSPGCPENVKAQTMPEIVQSPSASEPLSLADAKKFLRVEHDADDELIASLIVAARNAVELATRRNLAAPDIPAPLLHATRLLLAQSYEHRDEVRPDALPETVAALIAPFRKLSI